MPFDVAKSSGTWKFDSSSENYPQISEMLGVPPNRFEKFGKAGYTVETSLSGDVMTTKVDLVGKVIENTFTLGMEGEEATWRGKNRRVTHTLEGDSLVSVYPDHDWKGLHVRTARRFVDDNTIHVDIKAGDLEGWVKYKRC